jgi:hypothetical protein
VTAETERTEGKFASREDVAEELSSSLDDANPGQVDGLGADGTTSYEVTDWTVDEYDEEAEARLRADLRKALDLLDLARCSSADPGILRSWVAQRTALLRRHPARKVRESA